MTYRNSFNIGDNVVKCKGGYKATGTIIGVGKTKSGAVRYMVEYDIIPGLIHIHSDNDLIPIPPVTLDELNAFCARVESWDNGQD